MSNDYEFTTDWIASTSPPVWRAMIEGIKPRRALEVGSFEGRSAIFMIENCAEFGRFELTCVDTWGGGSEHQALDMAAVEARFDRNMARVKAKYDCHVRKLKSDSGLALARLLAEGEAESFDVAYIDGSHQAADVLSDAVLAFKLLRIGGAMVFDDYLWAPPAEGNPDLLTMPKLAIDAFINIHLWKLHIVTDAPLRQVYVVKRAS